MPIGQVPGGAVIHLLEQAVYVGRGHGIRTLGDRGLQSTPIRAVEERFGNTIAAIWEGLL